MSIPEQDRDRELAELLAEVRALRREIEALKADPSAASLATRPAYEVLVRARPNAPPDYQVAVKAGALTPGYAVAVRQTPELSADYEVAVRALVPGETVLARPAYRPGYEVAVNTLPKLPPDYAVAVKVAAPPAGEQVTASPDYAVAVKAFHPKDAIVLPLADRQVGGAGTPALPADYEVAVRGPFITPDDPARRKG